MAHAEIFKSPEGKWYWIALWNDRSPELSEEAFDSAEAAWEAAVAVPLPLTIGYRHGVQGLRDDPPPPDIHAG